MLVWYQLDKVEILKIVISDYIQKGFRILGDIRVDPYDDVPRNSLWNWNLHQFNQCGHIFAFYKPDFTDTDHFELCVRHQQNFTLIFEIRVFLNFFSWVRLNLEKKRYLRWLAQKFKTLSDLLCCGSKAIPLNYISLLVIILIFDRASKKVSLIIRKSKQAFYEFLTKRVMPFIILAFFCRLLQIYKSQTWASQKLIKFSVNIWACIQHDRIQKELVLEIFYLTLYLSFTYGYFFTELLSVQLLLNWLF